MGPGLDGCQCVNGRDGRRVSNMCSGIGERKMRIEAQCKRNGQPRLSLELLFVRAVSICLDRRARLIAVIPGAIRGGLNGNDSEILDSGNFCGM